MTKISAKLAWKSRMEEQQNERNGKKAETR